MPTGVISSDLGVGGGSLVLIPREPGSSRAGVIRQHCVFVTCMLVAGREALQKRKWRLQAEPTLQPEARAHPRQNAADSFSCSTPAQVPCPSTPGNLIILTAYPQVCLERHLWLTCTHMELLTLGRAPSQPGCKVFSLPDVLGFLWLLGCWQSQTLTQALFLSVPKKSQWDRADISMKTPAH
jgi:hypothetical protein